MKPIQPASARALTASGGLVLLGGLLVPSPSGAFVAFCLAALLTAFPAIFGTGKPRVIAAVLLLFSSLLAAGKHPEFKSEQERYRKQKHAVFYPLIDEGRMPV